MRMGIENRILKNSLGDPFDNLLKLAIKQLKQEDDARKVHPKFNCLQDWFDNTDLRYTYIKDKNILVCIKAENIDNLRLMYWRNNIPVVELTTV